MRVDMKKQIKTNVERQAEMAKKRREAGQKQTSMWIDEEITQQIKILSGMNKNQAMTTGLKLGLYAMGLIKKQDSDLYLSLVDGNLSEIQTKLDRLLT